MQNVDLPDNNILTKKEEQILLAKVKADFSYKATTEEWREARREELETMGMESETRFYQYMSLRHHLQRRKHQENFSRVKDELWVTLDSLQDALKVSKRHQISPLETCKVVLRKLGWEWHDIMELLPEVWTSVVGTEDVDLPSKKRARSSLHSLAARYVNDGLTVEDLVAIYECSLEDRPLSKDFNNHKSINFKEQFEELFLSGRGIHYVTQDDLRNSSYNTRIAKPSFWFPRGILINGKLAYWVDCRSAYGSNHIAEFYLKRMSKQVNGHKKAFGEGALIFHLGCSEEFRVDFMREVDRYNPTTFQIVDGSICPVEKIETRRDNNA